MKKLALILVCLFLCEQILFAETFVYSDNKKFGLKNNSGDIITKAKYKKLVRLGDSAWIFQKKTKLGIIDDNGNILTEPVYNQAERILGKYVKFRKGSRYCLLNEKGEDVIGNSVEGKPSMFSSIDLLPGGLIVTSKHHKFGLHSFNGNTQLDNIFDDIYMPDRDTLVVVYGGKSLEFKRQNSNDSPFNFVFIDDLKDRDIKLVDLATSPLATTGYYGITFTDYVLKIISSISPAYEETIDELMFSQGADTITIFMKFSWLPKFPFVYARNYYYNVTDPTNGPLNQTKNNLRQQIKE